MCNNNLSKIILFYQIGSLHVQMITIQIYKYVGSRCSVKIIFNNEITKIQHFIEITYIRVFPFYYLPAWMPPFNPKGPKATPPCRPKNGELSVLLASASSTSTGIASTSVTTGLAPIGSYQ